jgi:hypothetical protein
MAMRRMKKETKRLSKPTNVFGRSAKKSTPDDEPGRMRGGSASNKRKKKLAGMMI